MRKFKKCKWIPCPSIKKIEVIRLDNKKLKSICFQKSYSDLKWNQKINKKEVVIMYLRQI